MLFGSAYAQAILTVHFTAAVILASKSPTVGTLVSPPYLLPYNERNPVVDLKLLEELVMQHKH